MKKLALAFCFLLATAQLTCAENTQSLSYFTRFTNYVTQFFSQPFFQTIRSFFVAEPIKTETPKPTPHTTIPQQPSVAPSVATPVPLELPAPSILPIPSTPPAPPVSTRPGFLTAATKQEPASPTPITIAPTLTPIVPTPPSALKKLSIAIDIPEIKSDNPTNPVAPLIVKLQNDLNAMVPQDPDEIVSPEIKKETLQNFNKTIVQLDTVLQTLPQLNQAQWNQKIKNMIDPAQQNIKTLMMDVIKDEWNHHGKELVQLASGIARAAMTSAGISFAIQAARIGTGNISALDTNALLIVGLDAAAAFALSHYQKYLTIAPETASNIVTQTIITPSVSTRNFTIAIPSLRPSLNYWMISQGINIASNFIQNNNAAIQLTLKNINVQQVLFGKKSPTTAITPNLSSFVHDVLSNQNIKQTLISVGGTVMQSALIGGLLYLTGFGYAESTMLESMGTAMITAVAQGTVAQIANIRHSTSPGALINITAAPLGQQLFAIAGSTSQAAASAVIQAVATEVTNVIIEETTQEESGLKQMFKQATKSVQSGYTSLWSSFASGWKTFGDIVQSATTNSDEQTGDYLSEAGYGHGLYEH